MIKNKFGDFKANINRCLIGTFSTAISISPRTIAVVAPHPDDEIFGFGGALLKLLHGGSQAYIIYLTDGEGSGIWHDTNEIRRQRILLSEKAIMLLGIDNSNIYRLHFSDNSLPQYGQSGFEKIVAEVKSLIDLLRPEAVFATHPIDFWPFDHVSCAEIVSEAIKHTETKPQLWYYWVWAWYNLRPWKLSFRKLQKLKKVDISQQLPMKIELMDIYLNSLTPDGKPWSGILPLSLLKAFKSSFEVIEEILLTNG